MTSGLGHGAHHGWSGCQGDNRPSRQIEHESLFAHTNKSSHHDMLMSTIENPQASLKAPDAKAALLLIFDANRDSKTS
jgi:hypothetical protein